MFPPDPAQCCDQTPEIILGKCSFIHHNPASNTWAAITTNGAPCGRDFHVAAWTDSEMIVRGGAQRTATGEDVRSFNDGGRYNPATDAWTPVSTNGAPPAAANLNAVWTGNELIVWGGADLATRGPGGSVTLSSGGRYSPATDSWKSLPSTGAPRDRDSSMAIWTGVEMVFWGGTSRELEGPVQTFLNDGARYNPQTDAWTPLSLQNAPSPRVFPRAVWTGQAMILYAGYNNQDGSNELNTTHVWTPTSLLYLYQRR